MDLVAPIQSLLFTTYLNASPGGIVKMSLVGDFNLDLETVSQLGQAYNICAMKPLGFRSRKIRDYDLRFVYIHIRSDSACHGIHGKFNIAKLALL